MTFREAGLLITIEDRRIVVYHAYGYLDDNAGKALSFVVGQHNRTYKYHLFNFSGAKTISDDATKRMASIITRNRQRRNTLAICTAKGEVLSKLQQALEGLHVEFFKDQREAQKNL